MLVCGAKHRHKYSCSVLTFPLPLWEGRHDSDKILWRKTYVIAICYTLVTMPIPIILPKMPDDEYENVVIFWVVEKASTSGGGYSTYHLLGSLFKITWDPQMQIQCICIGQKWKNPLQVFIKILNCILNSFFPFFLLTFQCPKRIGFWKINHKSKMYWLLWFIGEKM